MKARGRSDFDPARIAAFTALCALERGATWSRARGMVAAGVERELDRRFAHELLAGTTRRRGALDSILARHARRAPTELDLEVRVLLRLGLYQLLELDRVAEHSAVHTTVEIAKRHVPRAAGFVNAVLRAAQRARHDAPLPDRTHAPVRHLAERFSHPDWLVERWLARFGFEETASLCAYNDRRPEIVLRANVLRTTRGRLVERLEGAFAGRWSPAAVRGGEARWSALRAAVDRGWASVQDESAQLVAPLLDARAGGVYVDVAAAPGGKATHLAELAGGGARVLAFDRNAARLERVRGNAARLGLAGIEVAVAEARSARDFAADGVLVDAPCSGLGVLSRRPDLRWRKRAEDLPRLARLQGEILSAAARLVRPGGLLVYSVCSFEPEETIDVARDFASRHPEMRLEAADVDPALQVEAGLLYFLPQRHGVDGGFAARWRRSR